MIGYVTVGTSDLEKSGAFFDQVFAPLGAKRIMGDDHAIHWSTEFGQPMVTAIKPFNGEKPSPGNGTMVSLVAPGEDVVRAVYDKAISLGAKDEGEPGFRGEQFYGAYFRDLEGNKFCVFFFKR